jgi:hypothetical protein
VIRGVGVAVMAACVRIAYSKGSYPSPPDTRGDGPRRLGELRTTTRRRSRRNRGERRHESMRKVVVVAGVVALVSLS